MRSPEEIKYTLHSCMNSDAKNPCLGCPYKKIEDCEYALNADALAYIQQLEDHIGDLTNMVPRWISVKEREPEPFTSVLGYIPDETPMPVVREGYRVNVGNCNAYYFPVLADRREITHWMEIPEPPKEENENVT